MEGRDAGSMVAAEEVVCVFRGAAAAGGASRRDGLVEPELLGLKQEKEVYPFR